MRAPLESQKVEKKLNHCGANRRCFRERYFRGRRTDRIGSGKRGRRGGLSKEGGIYEIAGHPPTATMVNSGDRWAVALTYIRVQGWKSRSLGYIEDALRARACVYVVPRTRRISGWRGVGGDSILEKPRPERHWPSTEPCIPLLGQSCCELITVAVLLSAFRLLKTLGFRALYQRGVCMYMYIHIYIHPSRVYRVCISPSLSSTKINHLLFPGSEKISLLATVHYRWLLEIVRSSVSF